MLAELSVENLAIIDRAQIQFGPGLTVLTGETGAGKSLLVDALQLALGDRADTESIRSGARSATVSAVFDLSASPEAAARCEELGLALEEGALYVQREVLAEGRSQCRIDGRLVPVSVLKQLGQALADLHGQHDHQSLLMPERHLAFLDRWIGQPAADLLTEVAALHERVRALQVKLEALRSNVRDREHRLDLLRHQIREIEETGPKIGEFGEVEARLGRLQNIEKLVAGAFGALGSLGQQENCAIDLAGSALRSLEEVEKFDPDLAQIAASLRDALYQLDEASHELSRYAESLESDPQALDEIVNRLDALKRLRRKYGDDETEVLRFLEEAKDQLSVLEDAETGQEALSAELEGLLAQRDGAAARLSALRKEFAARFALQVEDQLKDLALERARLDVVFRPKEPDGTGCDDAEFHFTANPGEPLRPLSRIASGGEVSRLMLAIKSVLAGAAGVPTLVFDEVDSGLGGRVAATLGQKLEELGQGYQVLVISHLPQVAARAATHFKIEKLEREGRTVTEIRRLDDAERVEEIARMLGGHAVTESALAHARELLGCG
jgi:DNA repair protein RecN (Recombination protein N)